MRQQIEAAWDNRELLKDQETIQAIETVIEDLDKGLEFYLENNEDKFMKSVMPGEVIVGEKKYTRPLKLKH